MRSIYIFILFFLPLATSHAQEMIFNAFPDKHVSDLFTTNWKSNVGITNFRTNIVYAENLIFIGSNGMDAGHTGDEKDGVYAIDPKTGEIIHHYQSEHENQSLDTSFKYDGDVSGIAVADGKVFFGADNDHFYCYTIDNKLLWEKRLIPIRKGQCYHSSGSYVIRGAIRDIECAPGLSDLTNDGIKDIVIPSESGIVYALNGLDGEIIWKKDLGEASRKFYLNIGAPALFDLNKDSIADVFLSSRVKNNPCPGGASGAFSILDGKTGNMIYQKQIYTGMSSATRIYITKEDTFALASGAYGTILKYSFKSKNALTFSPNKNILSNSGIEGFFGTPYLSETGAYCMGNSWWGINRDGIHYWNSKEKINKYYYGGRTSATAIQADILNKGFDQIIIPDEIGQLFILKKSNGDLIERLLIPDEFDIKMPEKKDGYPDYQETERVDKVRLGAEASVFVEDIDNDGRLELLIASLDGFLYCYKTKSKAKSNDQSRFINNTNNVIRLSESNP